MSLASAGMGLTMSGPEGVLIPLGLVHVTPSLTLIVQIYNFFSIFITMLLAVSASQRDTRFISILMPIWAGFCMLAGWLKYPNMGTGFGILVVCTIIAIMTYMQETRHERFGIAGPGNNIVKIFMFLIILQCVVVFVNSASIFPDMAAPIATTTTQYANIQQESNFDNINGAGGLTNVSIVDIITMGTQMVWSMLKLLLECLVSIALFSVILVQVFPWILQAGAIGAAVLVVIQFAIWGMYLLFMFALFYKPSPDPGW